MQMKSLEYYLHCIDNLRRAPVNGGAPHKPVLLLSIIDGYKKGEITDNHIYITPELLASFHMNWLHYVDTEHSMNFSLPFFHMNSEPFWKLEYKATEETFLTKSRSIKSFNALYRAAECAVIDPELAGYLQQGNTRNKINAHILEVYFPDKGRLPIPSEDYLNTMSRTILTSTSELYVKSYKEKFKKLNKERKEEDKFIRRAVFIKEVLKQYRNTCAITGMSIECDHNISVLDACHIVPRKTSFDDTITNGIALCPNMHRAFDRGLITVTPDYVVQVSKCFRDTGTSSHSFMQYHEKKISLPENPAYYPDPDNLRWHNEKVFKG